MTRQMLKVLNVDGFFANLVQNLTTEKSAAIGRLTNGILHLPQVTILFDVAVHSRTKAFTSVCPLCWVVMAKIRVLGLDALTLLTTSMSNPLDKKSTTTTEGSKDSTSPIKSSPLEASPTTSMPSI